MRKIIFKQLGIALGVLASFFLVFSLLQDPVVYHATLGKISSNYKHDSSGIHTTQEPYVAFNNANVQHWDAVMYKRIRDDSYFVPVSVITEKYAFYPFYPLVWKLSGIDSEYIVFFNYALFVIALILFSILLCDNPKARMIYFFAALLIPSAVIFYLPYAEAVFTLTFAIAVWGLLKNKYWLYFLGIFLFAATRPAVVVFIMALLAIDFVIFLRTRNIKQFIFVFFKKAAPAFAGFFAVASLQFYYSGSFTAYFECLNHFWPRSCDLFAPITDWSLEGFGMSVFSIFFICAPALIYMIIWTVKSLGAKEAGVSLFESSLEQKKEYLFYVSLAFLGGNLVYTFLTSGNEIDGFCRYTTCVPFFFIVLFQLPQKLISLSFMKRAAIFSSCLLAFIIFFNNVSYVRDHIRFEYFGLLLFILLALFTLFESYIADRYKWLILFILLIPSLIWQTYLFNMFLSNAWIFA